MPSMDIREAMRLDIPRISVKAIIISMEIPRGIADLWIEWHGYDTINMRIEGNYYRYEQLGWIRGASSYTAKVIENVCHFGSNYHTIVKYVFQKY